MRLPVRQVVRRAEGALEEREPLPILQQRDSRLRQAINDLELVGALVALVLLEIMEFRRPEQELVEGVVEAAPKCPGTIILIEVEALAEPAAELLPDLP